MLVCPRTSLLRACGRLDMLGVVGKELDVQMSPDDVPTWYLPEVAIFYGTLRHLSISLQILPKDLEGSRIVTKVARLQKLHEGVGYRQRTSYYTKLASSTPRTARVK